ncbi:MAG: ROK family protein [Planctomycetaceae bacterium]|nr:ROK family protein [Planctomycetaceae bacterium]
MTETQSPCFVGVEISKTLLRVGVVDSAGRSLARLDASWDVGPDGPDVDTRVAKLASEAIEKAGAKPGSIGRLGLAVPDVDAWKELQPRLAERCGTAVTMAESLDASARGEFWVGAGRGFHSMVLLSLDADIGCSILVDETAENGENNHGGQCGHILIDCTAGSRLCGCGQRGHLAAYVSEAAVLDRAREAITAGRQSSLSANNVSIEKLTAEADRGDALSREIVAETARVLAVGIATVLHTVDPSGVLLRGGATFGGNSTATGRQFLETVREEIGRRAFPVLAQRTVIDYVALGDDAAWIGAAGLARLEQLRGSSRSA